MHGHADLRAERLELLDGGRAVDVGRDQQREASVLLEMARELARDGRLADALQADQHDRRHAALFRQRRVDGSHQRHELLVARLHEMLAGRHADHASGRVAHARVHLLAERALLHAVEEVAHHRQVDVGLEQRHAHVAQRVGDVVLGQLAHTRQTLARSGESLGERLEHGGGE